MLAAEDDTALLIAVRVTPKSGKNEIQPYSAGDDWVKIKVTAPPEDGKANLAVVEVLAKALSVPKSRIALLSGATSRQKRFRVSCAAGELPKDLAARLGVHLGYTPGLV